MAFLIQNTTYHKKELSNVRSRKLTAVGRKLMEQFHVEALHTLYVKKATPDSGMSLVPTRSDVGGFTFLSQSI